MLTAPALPFLPAGRALRRYRATLAAELAAEPIAQLLPGLLSLPLEAAPLPDPAAILALPGSLGLYGPPTSGRTLAMLQVAQRWAGSSAPGPVLYIPLAELDAPNLSPRAVIAAAVHKAGLPASLANGGRPGILLIDDWELLAADRRAIWRAFLTTTAPGWPTLRAVIALPAGDQWPELAAVSLAPPDAERVAAWLAHLLPGHDTGPLAAALLREPLARLSASLADVALLALSFPLAGLPGSRAELYAQAYALAKSLGEEARVGRAVLRHYRLARSLAGGDDLRTLASLAPLERAAVAPLAAGLLDDPTPVLAPLWSDGEPDEADLRALVACALESPARAPAWGLRLVERLAAPSAPARERALLAELRAALPALLAAAGQQDEPRALAALMACEAALGTQPRPWLAMLDSLTAPLAMRWRAADLLAAAPPAPDVLGEPVAIADATTLAARAFVVAVAGDAYHHLLLQPPLRAGFEALLDAAWAGARRAAAATAVLANGALPDSLRALALGAAGNTGLVEQSALGASAALRRAAIAELGRTVPAEALAAIERILGAETYDPMAWRDALDAAAELALPTATGLLARVAAGKVLAPTRSGTSLELRVHAVDLLAGRGAAGMMVLQRLLAAPGWPLVLRAAAVGHLGRLGVADALPALRNLLEHGEAPLLRRAAARALGALGARAGLGAQAAAALVTGLRRVGLDTGLGEQIARALGHTGASMAMPTLAALVGPELEPAVRRTWLRRLPGLATEPAAAWPDLATADDTRLALIDVLADGDTTADPPTSLHELSTRQATRIAIAAVTAIADLAGLRPDLAPVAHAALRGALADPARHDLVRAALDALARLGDPAQELAALLNDPHIPHPIRWLALERLGVAPAAQQLMLRRLDEGADDVFLQTAMVAMLGAHRYRPALATLHRLARAADTAPQLRQAALAALGQLSDPAAVEALLGIAVDTSTPREQRCAAAAQLPDNLGGEQRATLHQAARYARQQPEVGVALARALARSRDYEALPALVRSAQSSQGAEAVESIEAIAALGDSGTTPLLVRISQSPTAVPAVRLAAVGALLRIGGAEYLPLLREYLTSASALLRIQAHAALAAAIPDDPRLGDALADPDAPLTLRLQALRHVRAQRPHDPVLGLALLNQAEQPQLRLAAAEVLAELATPAAVAALATLLDDPATAPVLRRHCVAGLYRIARGQGPAAQAARSALARSADGAGPLVEQRHWAAEALVGC